MDADEFNKLKNRITKPMTTNIDLKKMSDFMGIKLNDIITKDYLQYLKPINGSYIINLNNSDKQGTHWVCFYLNNGVAYYFDSFGIVPPLEIMKFIKRYTRRIYLSDKTIQKLNSGGCGLYCLMFLYHMTHSKKSKLIAFKKFMTFFK